MKNNLGMMWSTNTKQYYDDVIGGINYYLNKYGGSPNCVHVATLEDAQKLESFKEDGITVVVDRLIIPNSVWIGEQE